MSQEVLLAIDQGTSSSRAIGFSAEGEMLAVEQQSFEQIYPAPGWVEHDAEVIWATAMSTSRRALQRLREQRRAVAAVGITNQRETTVLWDRRSGAPLYNAIVWQDRRTARSLPRIGPGQRRGGTEPQDRAAARPLFFRHQDRVDSRPRTRRARCGQGRAHRLRYHRQFPAVAAERRTAARDGRHQRQSHGAL